MSNNFQIWIFDPQNWLSRAVISTAWSRVTIGESLLNQTPGFALVNGLRMM
jgi:hypothetical protein